MSDEEELKTRIQGMFEDYLGDGLDFNSSQSLEDIFRNIFTDAVNLTIKVYEKDE
jgi:hypothetical protein